MQTYDPLNVLKPIDDNIWMVDGPIIEMDFPLGAKVRFPTRMVIVRLASGDLWLHSPIEADPALLDAVRELGPVRHILASNSIHYWYVPDWAEKFPDAVTYGPSGLAETAKREIRLDHSFSANAKPEWNGEIQQLLFEGSVVTEAVFFHVASKTLVLSDLIENFEPAKVEKRWLRWIMGLVGILDPDGKMPFDLRMTFRKNSREFAANVERMLAWEPEKVIMAHGRPYLENGSAELQRAFRWVKRTK